MFARRGRRAVLLLFVTGVAICSFGHAAFPERHLPTRFVFEPLQRHTAADFDGDGRPDVAVIEARTGGISVGLSGSSEQIRLETSVSAVADVDIDLDGDVDLLATTTAGNIVVWLNDGHGRFTRSTPLGPHDMSGQPVVSVSGGPADLAIGNAAGYAITLAQASFSPRSHSSAPAARSLIPRRRLRFSTPLRAPPFVRL